MAKERDLKLLDYDISDNRYRELKYFCRQYKEKQKKLCFITESALLSKTSNAKLNRSGSVLENVVLKVS